MNEGQYTIDSWKGLIKNMPDQELKELRENMEFLLQSWQSGDNGEFVLRLDIAKQEIQHRERVCNLELRKRK